MQSQNNQDFPIFPYQDIFAGIKEWGFQLKADRILQVPTSDFIASVIEIFLTKMGYNLHKMQVKHTSDEELFENSTFEASLRKHMLVELAQEILSEWGYHVLTPLDIFCPTKKGAKQLLSCILYIVNTKNELNKEIPPEQNRDLHLKLEKCQNQAEISKLQFEKLKEKKANNFPIYEKNLHFNANQSEQISNLKEIQKKITLECSNSEEVTRITIEDIQINLSEQRNLLTSELKSLKYKIVQSPMKLKGKREQVQSQIEKFNSEFNETKLELKRQNCQINFLKGFQQKLERPLQESEQDTILREKLETLELKISAAAHKQDTQQNENSQQQAKLLEQETIQNDLKKCLKELGQDLEKMKKESNGSRQQMSKQVIVQEEVIIKKQSEVNELLKLIEEIKDMISQLQSKMDIEMTSKNQLYSQLVESINGYNNFFQNAINTKDEVYYQLSKA